MDDNPDYPIHLMYYEDMKEVRAIVLLLLMPLFP